MKSFKMFIFLVAALVITQAVQADPAAQVPTDKQFRSAKSRWGDICADNKATQLALLKKHGKFLGSYKLGPKDVTISDKGEESSSLYLTGELIGRVRSYPINVCQSPAGRLVLIVPTALAVRAEIFEEGQTPVAKLAGGQGFAEGQDIYPLVLQSRAQPPPVAPNVHVSR